MADICKSFLIGRLVKDCELTRTPSGMAICSFTIACNRNKKTEQGYISVVSYFDIKLYGKSAENLAQYLTKAKQVVVDCWPTQSRWEKDGQKFAKVEFIAEKIQFCNLTKGEQNAPQNQGGQTQYNAPEPQYNYNYDENSSFPEDIPF